ncbi:MAG: hypothetical protein M0C28_23415 [Candidatus Moduliflexus flocculans]|nr:hypothetical protein [Candidatus Moduliflexus flocculans]
MPADVRRAPELPAGARRSRASSTPWAGPSAFTALAVAVETLLGAGRGPAPEPRVRGQGAS